MITTKRGRGQRRRRRMKNRSTEHARAMALQHLRWNPVSVHNRASYLVELTHFFRRQLLHALSGRAAA